MRESVFAATGFSLVSFWFQDEQDNLSLLECLSFANKPYHVLSEVGSDIDQIFDYQILLSKFTNMVSDSQISDQLLIVHDYMIRLNTIQADLPTCTCTFNVKKNIQMSISYLLLFYRIKNYSKLLTRLLMKLGK